MIVAIAIRTYMIIEHIVYYYAVFKNVATAGVVVELNLFLRCDRTVNEYVHNEKRS